MNEKLKKRPQPILEKIQKFLKEVHHLANDTEAELEYSNEQEIIRSARKLVRHILKNYPIEY